MKASFDSFMSSTSELVLQPRMGFSLPRAMRNGLRGVKGADAHPCVGTITVDALTRLGHYDRAAAALANGESLNGYPIVTHPAKVTRALLDGLFDASFPVQVRHGSPAPMRIFECTAAAGLDALEGGPVSYSMPYSRAPLADSVARWREATGYWAEHGRRTGVAAHLESFGGCMFGQLSPPSPLVALSVLECGFFRENGITSASLSLAQGTSDEQDIGALVALDRLAARHLGDMSYHVVFYTFMGRFPRTRKGAEEILRTSARIAIAGRARRLIVKTAAEAHGIPTIEQNVDALRQARESADAADPRPSVVALAWADVIEQEAESLIAAVRGLAPNLGDGLLRSFADGVLDLPHVPHPALRGLARAGIDETGALIWTRTGAMPIRQRGTDAPLRDLDSASFERALDLNRVRYDGVSDENGKERVDA
jgi:methylaspartate mutase epsilon subunit